jgi:hypothetical protein
MKGYVGNVSFFLTTGMAFLAGFGAGLKLPFRLWWKNNERLRNEKHNGDSTGTTAGKI